MNGTKNNLLNNTLPAIALALGIVVAGYLIGEGLIAARSSERRVSVRGLAEREVAANLALWPIVFSVTSNELGDLQRKADEGVAKVQAFLASDFPPEQISVSAPRVQDRQAQRMNGDGRQLDRYTAEVTVTVRTDRIDVAKKAIQRSGELVKQGVAVIRSYEYNTQYLFTELDKIKPEMIAEATKDARHAAEQFAKDSGGKVGAIRTAQQGLFSIADRDQFSPEFKTVRVVTTVDYYLVD